MLNRIRKTVTPINIRRTLTGSLTALAFVNSYRHTVEWFSAHGQSNEAELLALIPEAGVILSVLTLVMGNLNRAERVIISLIGMGSLAVTFWSNLAGAADGAGGVAAALVAPIFGVLGFALEAIDFLKKKSRTRKVPAEKAQKPVSVPKKASGGTRTSLTDKGILWATERTSAGAPWPTTKEIMAQFPEISETTARKIRRSEPSKVS